MRKVFFLLYAHPTPNEPVRDPFPYITPFGSWMTRAAVPTFSISHARIVLMYKHLLTELLRTNFIT